MPMFPSVNIRGRTVLAMFKPAILLRATFCTLVRLNSARGTWKFPLPPSRRAVSSLSPNQASYNNCCKEVVESQHHKLVIPRVWSSRVFLDWPGDVMTLDPNPLLMPFVERHTTLMNMVEALDANIDIANGVVSEPCSIRSLTLVGCGALFGTGKSAISRVLHQCLQRKLEPDRRVIFNATSRFASPYDLWQTVAYTCMPGMEGLEGKIHGKMSWQRLVSEATKYLTAENLHLFLHLDAFLPFDESGQQENTANNFYQCWRRMLMPLLKSPRISLYISGNLPYLDSFGSGIFGQPPCHVQSVQLNLFDADIIHNMLCRISIPTPPGTPSGTGATVALSVALDATLQATTSGRETQESGSREIARRLYEVTGGGPRFLECALYKLLSDDAVHAALFDGDRSGDLHRHLESLFQEGGAVYQEVVCEARNHFSAVLSSTNLLEDGDRSRDQHVAGLLLLVFLQGQPLPLDPWVIARLNIGILNWSGADSGAFLLHEARYWGIHRDVDQEGHCVRFPLSAAVLESLNRTFRRLLRDFPDFLRKPQWMVVQSKYAKSEVETALAFHRLLADVVGHHNWLRVGPSSAAASAASPLMSTNAASAARLSRSDDRPLFQLPRHPRIAARGRLPNWEHMWDIAHRSGADESADFLVRSGGEVTHLHVKGTQHLTMLALLEDCCRVAAMVTKKGAADLHHTLLWVTTEPDGVKEAMASLSVLKQLVAGDASAQRISSAVVAGRVKALLVEAVPGELRSGMKAGRKMQKRKPELAELSAAEKRNERHIRAAVLLLRKGKLNVVVLGEEDREEFLQYNRIAKDLLGN